MENKLLKELQNYQEGFSNLQLALRYYISKCDKIIKTTDNKDVRIQYRSMKHTYTWILNSIGHRGFILHERHGSNITNCLFRDLEFTEE